MIGGILKCEEFKLSQEESKVLAEAAGKVAGHYDLGVPQKSLDWFNLIQCMALVYGPRFAVLAARKKPKPVEDVQPSEPEEIIPGIDPEALSGMAQQHTAP